MKKTVCKIILALVFGVITVRPATAQFYPTQYRPDVNWQQLITPHFRIIFPYGKQSTAKKTAQILEYHYPRVQDLTGGRLSHFPVILYGYNDLSNGVVTTLHFRSEIAIPPIKGKSLNPETGGWFQNVAPHELVHAMQFSNLSSFGIGRIVNLFSPDLARSLYGAIPAGLTEGLAVYHESDSVTPGGGRGNYPWFTNQFNATFTDRASRWSLGQMVHFPVYTRPFDRHYIGGYEFTGWLQDTYGYETTRVASDFYISLPFLGYGLALLHATGQWPWQLYNQFEVYQQNKLSDTQKTPLTPLPLKAEGAEIRRPKWQNDSTLIFHGSFYNARPGFYRYHLDTKKSERLITTHSTSDFNYALSDDKTTLIYSFYRPDLIYNNAYKAELVKADIATGQTQRITSNGRIWAPVFLNDSTLLGLQTEQSWSQIVRIDATQNYAIDSVLSLPPFPIISVAVHPKNADMLAVVINKSGTQALWLASLQHLERDLKKPPVIAFENGSVFDPVWHPDGNKLLFTADFSGVMQVYEYNVQNGHIVQLTNTSFNAFEASYSPDGNRIAFIVQQTNEKLPAILSQDNFLGKTLPEATGNVSSIKPAAEKPAVTDTSGWLQSRYTAGLSWLKPRIVLPLVEEVDVSDSYEYGVSLHSGDLLQQQAYSVDLTYFEERLWYDFTYQNKQFFPGFEASIYSRPSISRFGFITENQDTVAQTFVMQQRSFALSIPVQFNLNQNVFFSSLFIEPELRQSQLRFFNTDGDKNSDFAAATIGNMTAQFNYRLQQNIRDVQPNAGFILYGELEHYFNFSDITLNSETGTADIDFQTVTGLQGGIFAYLAPFRLWNQSLRLGLQAVTQTSSLFNNQDIVSDAFSEAVFPLSNNLLSFSSRYTIPLFYADDGLLLVPVYLGSVYLSLFTNTVADLTKNDLLHSSRTVYGGGIRFRFRISNLSLDIGVGIGWEPTRNNTELIIGNF